MAQFSNIKTGQRFFNKRSLYIRIQEPSMTGKSQSNAINLWTGKEAWFSDTVSIVRIAPIAIPTAIGAIAIFLLAALL